MTPDLNGGRKLEHARRSDQVLRRHLHRAEVRRLLRWRGWARTLTQLALLGVVLALVGMVYAALNRHPAAVGAALLTVLFAAAATALERESRSLKQRVSEIRRRGERRSSSRATSPEPTSELAGATPIELGRREERPAQEARHG